MNNPQRILQALDSHLRMPTRIVLFGRAALALGYDPPEPEFEVTNDVDAILPSVDMAAIERDEQFWNAIDAANRELEPAGLYITHLFSDQQVVITPHWLSRVVPIPFEGGRHLRLFRPAGADLLLTKMMRNDPQDLEDIRFILRRDRITRRQVMDVFAEARIPDVNEIREIFMSLRTVVESMAAEINS